MLHSKTPLIPRYARISLVLIFVLDLLVYSGSRWIRPDLPFHSFVTPADELIPFWSPFVIIYFLAYVQWVAGYVIVARESKEICYTYLSGEAIAKIICLFFFLFLPTTAPRPEITGTAPTDLIVKFLYQIDAPDNLFPSIHCLASWFCFRGALQAKKAPTWYPWVTGIFSLLVFASTLLTKQHVLLDVFGGIAVLEIGLWIAKKTGAKRVFYKMERRLTKEASLEP